MTAWTRVGRALRSRCAKSFRFPREFPPRSILPQGLNPGSTDLEHFSTKKSKGKQKTDKRKSAVIKRCNLAHQTKRALYKTTAERKFPFYGIKRGRSPFYSWAQPSFFPIFGTRASYEKYPSLNDWAQPYLQKHVLILIKPRWIVGSNNGITKSPLFSRGIEHPHDRGPGD